MKLKITLIVLLCMPIIQLNAAEYTCSNDYGECTIEESSGSCVCADGIATGWAGGSTGEVDGGEIVVEDSEEPAIVVDEAACLEALEMNCPAHEVCKNDKGICRVYENEQAYCTCADGSHNSGSGQTEPGYPGEDTDPDDVISGDDTTEGSSEDSGEGDEIVPLDTDFGCAETLIAECPNSAPDAEAECGDESFEICNNLSSFFADCYGETVWPYMIIECCDNYKESKSEIDEMWACLKDKSCDDANDCYGDFEAVGDSASAGGQSNYESLLGEEGAMADASSTTDGDTTDDDTKAADESDDSSSDCNQSGSAQGWLFLLFALAIFKPFRIKV